MHRERDSLDGDGASAAEAQEEWIRTRYIGFSLLLYWVEFRVFNSRAFASWALYYWVSFCLV